MFTIDFVESLRLKQVGHDTFTNIHKPWTWNNGPVIPGGLLISEAAEAAYQTVPSDFVIDNMQAQFIGACTASKPLIFKVQRLSQGRRFAIRAVTIEQEGVVMLHANVAFVHASPWSGPALRYSESRRTTHHLERIEVDDLEPNRTDMGPFMKFQRLPLVYGDKSKLETGITSSAAHIIPEMKAETGTKDHLLGILSLSDYHVMDAPLQLSGTTLGQGAIGDKSQTPQENMAKVATSLNHSIYFHAHSGFRADEMTYIEVGTSWSKDGRAFMNSRIFSKDGLLIATCAQEAFHVLKKDPPMLNSSKL